MQFKVCSKTKKISRPIFQLKAWISIRGVPEGGGVLGLRAWFTDIHQLLKAWLALTSV